MAELGSTADAERLGELSVRLERVPSIADLLDTLARKPESMCYVQELAPALTNIQVSKRPGMSKISFVSNQLSPSEFMANTGKVGFVLWIARDRLS